MMVIIMVTGRGSSPKVRCVSVAPSDLFFGYTFLIWAKTSSRVDAFCTPGDFDEYNRFHPDIFYPSHW